MQIATQHFDLGSFTVTGTGIISVTGLGFKPNIIEFRAESRITSWSVDTGGNSSNSASNYQGSSYGYAKWLGGSLGFEQRTVHSGGSGKSINHTSHYSSDSECLTIRYAAADGGSKGYTRCEMSAVTSDGFDVNVTGYGPNIAAQIVMYKAYRTEVIN
jgi:hypothetical protein